MAEGTPIVQIPSLDKKSTSDYSCVVCIHLLKRQRVSSISKQLNHLFGKQRVRSFFNSLDLIHQLRA